MITYNLCGFDIFVKKFAVGDFMKVTLRVPGTSANIGPGFDSLGCALTIYSYFTFEKAAFGLEITGCPEAYRNEKNLAYTSFAYAVRSMGKEICGLKIDIDTEVPVSRGLGSSATMIVAGVVAANILYGNILSTAEIFKICNEIEGHPDNIAPALFGGLTASMVDDGKPYTVKYNVDKSIKFCVLIPDFEVSTREARVVLPNQYSREDAVYNVSRTAVMLKAFEEGNEFLLFRALADKIHQPYRKKLINGYEVVESLAYSLGAISFFISGSGSTCIALTKDEGFGEKMQKAIKDFAGNWDVKMLDVSENGVEVIGFEE